MDIWFIVTALENGGYSFDVSKLFDVDINIFKIEKYNKNHEEVLDQLKEIFNQNK